MGMLSGLNLSRAAGRIAAAQPGSPLSLSTGLLRRAGLILAAFWLGSRFGLAGLLGAFGGVLAGFSAMVRRQAREAAHG